MSPIRLSPTLYQGALALLFALAVACGGDSASNPDGGDGAHDGGTGADAASRDAGPGVDGGVEQSCDILACEEDLGRTCDDEPVVVDCTEFGATCGDFNDTESGAPFEWCDCGELEELEGFCLGGRLGITCLDGLGGLADCGPGMTCVERPAGPFGIGCECNNFVDGVCPNVSCGGDPDCKTCTPDCEGRDCGDNGCGGVCGSCLPGSSCNESGTCESNCTPSCTGRECGSDGCGGSCGTCEGECTADGQCQGECVPSCTGRECGSDGCGGSCGTCDDGLSCGFDGTCGCPFAAVLRYHFELAPDDIWAEFFAVDVTIRHIDIDGSESQPDAVTLCDRDGCPGGDRRTSWDKLFAGCRAHARIRVRYHVLFASSCEVEQEVEDVSDFVIRPAALDGKGGCDAPPFATRTEVF
jgi:hypothetical protein